MYTLRGRLRGMEGHIKCKLKEIPKTLELNYSNCFLRWAVEFLPPPSTKGIGHFVAYCRRINGPWEYYDDMKEAVKNESTACNYYYFRLYRIRF